MPQKFTNVTPISGAQKFTNVTPIGGGPDPNNPAASIPNPAAHDNPTNPIARNPTYHDYETIGSSEGAGLAEGLSDWDKASFGEVGGGVADVARGDIAKGLHRTLSGGMSATLPALPFAAAAAPAVVARGAIAGTLAGKGAHAGAEMLGATPDQADLAGDVGNLAGAGVGAKAGGGRVAAVAKVGAQDAFSRIPVVGRVVRRPSAMDYVTAATKGEPRPASPGVEHRFPETPAPEVLQAASLERGAQPVVDPAAGLGGIPVRGAIAKQFKDPGAPLPEKPAQAFFQGRGLAEGGKTATDPAAGLGGIPVRGSIAEKMSAPTNAEPSPIAETPAAQQSAATPPAPPATPKGSMSKLMRSAQSSLEDGLGVVKPKVVPGKPIYQRGGIAQQMNSPSAEVPTSEPTGLLEGHTATESSWIKSYKYDPATREFEMHPKSGNAVRLGDVSPEDAAEFGKAESKGKAWQAIQRSPLIAKRINGQWQPVKPAGAR